MMKAYILMWQTERSFMTDGMTGVQAERLTKAYNEKKKHNTQGSYISKGNQGSLSSSDQLHLL